jgi:DNA-binding HxlR family transcriptional regulator
MDSASLEAQGLPHHDTDTIAAQCPVEEAMQLLTGKWRMLVLYRLRKGPMRFNALQRRLAPVTQKVLTATLRGLEADGLLWREVRAEVPPHVIYGLTPFAAGAAPVFEAMAEWILANHSCKGGTQ